MPWLGKPINKEANKQTIYDGLAIYFLRDGLSLSAVSFIRLWRQRRRPGHQQYVRDILWLFAYCPLSRVLLVTTWFSRDVRKD